jgi:hypothetical protein
MHEGYEKASWGDDSGSSGGTGQFNRQVDLITTTPASVFIPMPTEKHVG